MYVFLTYTKLNMQEPATTRRPPLKPRKTRWKYGNESDFKLLMFDGKSWRMPLYSHDVPNKAISKGGSREFNSAKKIERLQRLFDRGGTRGNSFEPAGISFAVIVPNFGKISDAIARWTPASGWLAANPSQAHKKSSSDWRLWLAGSGIPSKTFTAKTESDEFRQFALSFAQNKSHLIARFADPESAELPESFLIAAYLGEVAKRLHAGKKYQRAYIFHSQSADPLLRVDLNTGRLCGIGQGGGWVSPDLFFTL
jgi:hypothetical protein